MPYDPDKHHRRSIRLKGYDYSQEGMYFVTICCQDRLCRFGHVVDGEMILNKYGKMAYTEWLKTAHTRSNIQLDTFIVMPNHIHGIIIITAGTGVSHTLDHAPISGRGVLHTPHKIFNTGVCDTPLRSPSNTIGAIIRGYKSAVTKQMHESGCFDTVWQRNYYEHIIRNDKSYQTIAEYIINNPAKWNDDRYFHKQQSI